MRDVVALATMYAQYQPTAPGASHGVTRQVSPLQWQEEQRSRAAMAETQAQLSALSQFSDQLASVVDQAARSIVTVAARPRRPATGIIWRADTETIILTADHVIEREDEINVTLPNQRE